MPRRKTLWCLVCLILVACTRPPERPSLYAPPRSIAVLPFEVTCPGEGWGYFPCPVREIPTGEVAPGAAETMDRLLRELLASHPGFRFINRGDFEVLWSRALANLAQPSPAQIIKALGREIGTQALLYGRIFRFRERRGKGYAVERPASVAFALVLFDARSGRVLWKGWFDETQQPLSRNLFKIKLYGGVRWLTAEELARRGLQKVLKDFPFPQGGSGG